MRREQPLGEGGAGGAWGERWDALHGPWGGRIIPSNAFFSPAWELCPSRFRLGCDSSAEPFACYARRACSSSWRSPPRCTNAGAGASPETGVVLAGDTPPPLAWPEPGYREAGAGPARHARGSLTRRARALAVWLPALIVAVPVLPEQGLPVAVPWAER